MLRKVLERAAAARASELEGAKAAEAGFTLIELMVVLLIIAILLAIAIPTFLGVQGSANDRAAQSNLTNALTEAKALYQNGQSYLTASLPLGSLTSSAPEFSWVAGATACATHGNCVSEYPVDVTGVGTSADGAGVILATLSATNTCWFVADLEAAPVASLGADAAPGTAQFIAASAGTGVPGQWNNTGNATIGAGTWYSKLANGAAHCNASYPITDSAGTTPWLWGTTYTNAPAS